MTTIKNVQAKNFQDYFILQGRVYQKQEYLYLNHTASSMEGEFEGDSLTLVVKGKYHSNAHATYIRVLIDDTKQKVKIRNGEQVLTFAVSLGKHHFKIIKLPESGCCAFGIKELECSGQFLKLKNDRKLNIEFVGDSITAGYGNMARHKDSPFTTATEDGQRSFAYLVGEALHANYNVVAAGGHPIYKSPYSKQSLPSLYDNIDLYRNQDKWNFDTFRPDVIVIALGTNDMSYLKRLEEKQRAKEKEVFKQQFVDFVRALLKQNCYIVLLDGFYGHKELKEITYWVKSEIADNRVSVLQMKNIIESGDMRAGHPGHQTHKVTAKLLVEHIQKLVKNE